MLIPLHSSVELISDNYEEGEETVFLRCNLTTAVIRSEQLCYESWVFFSAQQSLQVRMYFRNNTAVWREKETCWGSHIVVEQKWCGKKMTNDKAQSKQGAHKDTSK